MEVEAKLRSDTEKFDGKPICFIGFLEIEFEGNAIYLHREDFDLLFQAMASGLMFLPTGLSTRRMKWTCVV